MLDWLGIDWAHRGCLGWALASWVGLAWLGLGLGWAWAWAWPGLDWVGLGWASMAGVWLGLGWASIGVPSGNLSVSIWKYRIGLLGRAAWAGLGLCWVGLLVLPWAAWARFGWAGWAGLGWLGLTWLAWAAVG